MCKIDSISTELVLIYLTIHNHIHSNRCYIPKVDLPLQLETGCNPCFLPPFAFLHFPMSIIITLRLISLQVNFQHHLMDCHKHPITSLYKQLLYSDVYPLLYLNISLVLLLSSYFYIASALI